MRKRSILTVCACWLLCVSSLAQSAGSQHSTKTYDTLLTGPGYGNYAVSFPQWNPLNGTLVSVKVNVSIAVQYGFTLKNVDVSASNYTLKVGREDYFSSPALSVGIDTVVEKTVGVYPLTPGASTTVSPFAFMDGFNISDSITDAVTPFLGTGRVSFAYSPVTYTTLRSSNNSSYSYQATASDQMRFSITYTYTPPIILATQITSFNALLKTDRQHTAVTWTVVNERAGLVYEVERSTDGVHFSTVDTEPYSSAKSGSYGFPDSLPPTGDKFYYRLKMTGGDSIVYSNVVLVSRPALGGGMRIFPDPVDDLMNVDLPDTNDGDFFMEIFAANGARVLTMTHKGYHMFQIFLNGRIAKGVYFIKATNIETGKYYLLSFVKK